VDCAKPETIKADTTISRMTKRQIIFDISFPLN
jgi:hypothetical protein